MSIINKLTETITLNEKGDHSVAFFISIALQSGKLTAPVAWHHCLWPQACHLEWQVWRPAWQSLHGSGSCPCGRVSPALPVYPERRPALRPARQACRCPSLSGAENPPVCHCRPCCRPHCCAGG